MKKLITLLTILITLKGYSQLPTDTIGFDGINAELLDSLVMTYINQERVKHNMSIINTTQDLKDVAYKHTEWMVLNKSFVHSGNGYRECINDGSIWDKQTYNEAAASIVKSWMLSPDHKGAILGNNSIGGTSTLTYKESEYIYGWDAYSTLILR